MNKIADQLSGDRDGATYEQGRDRVRLNRQAQIVWNAMLDGQWKSLARLSQETGEPEASISARIRDFRKPKFGGHEVKRHYLNNGCWIYRLIANVPDCHKL